MKEEPVRHSGHLTRLDGSHVTLSPEDAEALWNAVEEAAAKRAETMPTTHDALCVISSAKQRLGELGWRGGQYCSPTTHRSLNGRMEVKAHEHL